MISVLSDHQSQGRESPRVEADFRVSYPTIDELVVAYCGDLSKGGLFVATEHLLASDAVVRVSLDLPEGSGSIPILCRVIYTRDAALAEAQGKPVGMGLQFLHLDDEMLGLIEAFISERMTADAAKVSPIEAQRRLSILVADDDPTYLKQAAAPFRARGDYVRTAGDGMEALAMCLKEPPDIILSDVQMPRMDGWQFLRMVRARAGLAAVPVIFLTTLSGEEERLRGYQLGVDDYVAKPYRSVELRARVDRLTARAKKKPRTGERHGLYGDLEQVSLPSVLTFLELERKTGELIVQAERSAQIQIRDGRPLRIELEAAPDFRTPIELVHLLLDWRIGQFDFEVKDVTVDDQIHTSFTALLLEHARLDDESNR
jgi:uncharacterized protein (TIGR02266 family)